MRTEDLTAGQLIMAAWDLRNAALVVKHATHFKGALVDGDRGGVCIVGAIELATYKELLHYPGDRDNVPVWSSQAQYNSIEDGSFRAECAITVLAGFVPTGLCEHCDDEKPGHHCDCFPHCVAEPREAWEIATHYNDNHCHGGTMAVNVLRLAADHAEELGMLKKHRVKVLSDFLERERIGV
jgi:hypothetical protein